MPNIEFVNQFSQPWNAAIQILLGTSKISKPLFIFTWNAAQCTGIPTVYLFITKFRSS